MTRLLLVSLGGAIGTGARYLLDLWLTRSFAPGFPLGTFAVNLIGSFLLAALMYIGSDTEWMSPTLALAATTGLLGGFTTYSTFSYETMEYLRSGSLWLGGVYIASTVLCCLAASFAGLAAGRYLTY